MLVKGARGSVSHLRYLHGVKEADGVLSDSLDKAVDVKGQESALHGIRYNYCDVHSTKQRKAHHHCTTQDDKMGSSENNTGRRSDVILPSAVLLGNGNSI